MTILPPLLFFCCLRVGELLQCITLLNILPGSGQQRVLHGITRNETSAIPAND